MTAKWVALWRPGLFSPWYVVRFMYSLNNCSCLFSLSMHWLNNDKRTCTSATLIPEEHISCYASHWEKQLNEENRSTIELPLLPRRQRCGEGQSMTRWTRMDRRGRCSPLAPGASPTTTWAGICPVIKQGETRGKCTHRHESLRASLEHHFADVSSRLHDLESFLNITKSIICSGAFIMFLKMRPKRGCLNRLIVCSRWQNVKLCMNRPMSMLVFPTVPKRIG